MKKILIFILCLCLLLPCVPRSGAYTIGQPYHADLTELIRNDTSRGYVQMMLDYYLRTDTVVQMALEEGLSAVFLFEGCSDNMDHPDLSDLSYYRVSAVCIALRLNKAGEPYIAYFNDDCSTLPDRPLEYGAWQFDDVGEVGPATVCDGTYEIYSVKHAGAYEALHMRTDYSDGKISAVYMQPDGYVKTRATEINIHTRTGNHVIQGAMWSAGCMLVGAGDFARFEELIEATYYAVYEEFELDRKVGSVTINRQLLKEEMYGLYENGDAVDMILAASRRILPEVYWRRCSYQEQTDEPVTLCVRGTAELMSLPCSNATDARSVSLGTVTRGQELTAGAVVRNSEGNLWFEVETDGGPAYLYTGYAEEAAWNNWITRFLASITA